MDFKNIDLYTLLVYRLLKKEKQFSGRVESSFKQNVLIKIIMLKAFSNTVVNSKRKQFINFHPKL